MRTYKLPRWGGGYTLIKEIYYSFHHLHPHPSECDQSTIVMNCFKVKV